MTDWVKQFGDDPLVKAIRASIEAGERDPDAILLDAPFVQAYIPIDLLRRTDLTVAEMLAEADKRRK